MSKNEKNDAPNFNNKQMYSDTTRLSAVIGNTFLPHNDPRCRLWVKALTRYAAICPHCDDDRELEFYFIKIIFIDIHSTLAENNGYTAEFFRRVFVDNPLLLFSHTAGNQPLNEQTFVDLANFAFAKEQRRGETFCSFHLRILQGGMSIREIETWLNRCSAINIRNEQLSYIGAADNAIKQHHAILEYRQKPVSIRKKYGMLKKFRQTSEQLNLPWRITERMTNDAIQSELASMKQNLFKMRLACPVK